MRHKCTQPGCTEAFFSTQDRSRHLASAHSGRRATAVTGPAGGDFAGDRLGDVHLGKTSRKRKAKSLTPGTGVFDSRPDQSTGQAFAPPFDKENVVYRSADAAAHSASTQTLAPPPAYCYCSSAVHVFDRSKCPCICVTISEDPIEQEQLWARGFGVLPVYAQPPVLKPRVQPEQPVAGPSTFAGCAASNVFSGTFSDYVSVTPHAQQYYPMVGADGVQPYYGMPAAGPSGYYSSW